MSSRRETFSKVISSAVRRRGSALMGICNVTPDSFSDGGRFLDPREAERRVLALIAEGADIVDIGGESTRPGAEPVPAAVQLERVLPLVAFAARKTCVSIDTTSAEVAAACLDAGAHVVNDVSLLSEPDLARVTAGSAGVLVLSHARGSQTAMHGFGGAPRSAYGNVVTDVLGDWERAAAKATELGMPRSALVMDPGLGFSKAQPHSFELLRRAGELVNALDVPILFGASRKSFLTLVDRDAPADARIGASIAAALHAWAMGVQILRVHDVRATRQAIDMHIVLGTPRRKA